MAIKTVMPNTQARPLGGGTGYQIAQNSLNLGCVCVCVVGEWLLPAPSQCHTLLRVRFLRSTSRVCEPALPKGFVDGLQFATTLQRSRFAIETGIGCNAKGNNAQAIRDWRGR